MDRVPRRTRSAAPHCISYTSAVERYQQALAFGQQIGDFTSQLNSLKGLAYTCRAQDDMARACRYAQDLLALADSHPFFKTHPVVQGWRDEFAGWGCGATVDES